MRPLFLLLLGTWALGQNLEVARISPPARVRPGDFAVQVWQLRNHTPFPLSLHINAKLPPGWEALDLPETIPLAAGAEDHLFLVLYVPRTAESGVHPVRVHFRWDGEEVVAETAVEVEVVAALELSPPPPQAAEPGETRVFTLRVWNRGNALDRVRVEVRAPAGWQASVSPRELPLVPGEAGAVTVSLGIPGDAPAGRQVVLAVARSGLSPQVEARTAWYAEVLPPGPERIPVQLYAALDMRGFARFSYDFLLGSGTSFLGFSGRGAVLDGALELSARWAGPVAPQPLKFQDFQATYVWERGEARAGLTSLPFRSLLSGLGFWGLSTRLDFPKAELRLGSGWHGAVGRAGGGLLLRAPWGELGGAYREERSGGLHSQAGSLWLYLPLLDDVRFRLEGGAAQVQGLTRFAGETRLTWERPEFFFFEARGFAVDPDFPALVRDRAGLILSGRLGTGEASFGFACQWQWDDLRGFAGSSRLFQGIEAGWNFFPASWPLHLGLGLALHRTVALSFPPTLDERLARAELRWSFSREGFTLGAQATYSRFLDAVSALSWERWEFREWLRLTMAEELYLEADFSQIRLFSEEGESAQEETKVALRLLRNFQLSWEYGRAGGGIQAEVVVEPAEELALRLGAEARWEEEAHPTRFGAFLQFDYGFSWAPPFLPAFGALLGTAFVDSDGDGERDPGEAGLAGVVLALDEVQVSTGRDGGFRFPGRAPGRYALHVVRAPLGYAPARERTEVVLELGEKTYLSLPFLPLAELSGLVFLDVDADGVRDPGEPGLGRVHVRIVAAEGRAVEVRSDPLGQFSWPELFPGKCRVELILESLPPRHEATTPVALELVLAPGEKREVAFGVQEQPRPVVVIQPPWADFTWTPPAPQAGETVLFDAALSQAFEAEIVQYLWDFTDDGEVDAEGLRVSWVFPEPGLYLVTLVVVDSRGLVGRAQYLLQVHPGLPLSSLL